MNKCKLLHLSKGRNGNKFTCIAKMKSNEANITADCSLDPKNENYVDPEECVNGVIKRRK
jgi:hypothetical protein